MGNLSGLVAEKIDKLLEIYGEQTIEFILLGFMSFMFFLLGFLLIKQQSNTSKKGRRTTGEIVHYDNSSSLLGDTPMVKFEIDGKLVCRTCSHATLNRAEYPVGTVIDIVYLEKKTLGLV